MDFILYEDEYILVVDKPAGMPSQPDKTGCEDMTSLVETYIKKTPITINRLDRPVSGLMLFGKQPIELEIKKEYLAVVCGDVPKNGELVNFLLKNERLNVSKVVNKNTKNSKEARLTFDKLDSIRTDEGTLSLVRINLQTGRHHQIRVQLSHAGFPLWGDTKYNEQFARTKGFVNIALIAYRISFFHPRRAERIILKSAQKQSFPFILFFNNPENDF